MTESLNDALGDTLAKVEAKTLSDTVANVMAKALPDALAASVSEVKAETLYETLNNMKTETLVEALDDTLAKDPSRNTRQQTARCGHAFRGGGQDNCKHTNLCGG